MPDGTSFSMFPKLVDFGWPTTPDAILHKDAATASTTTLPDPMQLYGHDFSGLPASCDIDGIEVVVDGYKDEGAGSGTLRYALDLSWDGGSTWTTAKNSDPLTTSSAEYKLGGASDTWGRSWTRAEIATTSLFRCRITSGGSAILDVPAWHADYCSVRVFYTDTTAITLGVQESSLTRDSTTMPVLALSIGESVVARDSGSSTDTAQGIGSGVGAINLAGTAITELYSTGLSGFQSASLQHNAQTALAITFLAPGTSPLLMFASDATLASVMQAAAPSAIYQPGVIDWGDITFGGEAGKPSGKSQAVVKLRNSSFANFVTSTDTNLLEAIAAIPFLGAQFQVHVCIQDDGATSTGGWVRQLVYLGNVDSVTATEEYVEVRAIVGQQEEAQIPTLKVDESALTYGDKEGELPDEWSGTVVPIGYGRFDATALQDWPTGHPFTYADLLDPGAAFLPPYLGYKTPMMPVVLAADNYANYDGLANAARGPRMAIFLQGDSSSAPAIEVGTNKSSAAGNLRYYGATAFDPTNLDQDTELRYHCIYTWDSGLDRALPFRTDLSAYVDQDFNAKGGAGDLRAFGAQWTDGLARFAYPVFINRTGPETASELEWIGALQSVALFCDKQTVNPGATAYVADPSITYAADWYGSTGPPANPENALGNNMADSCRVPYLGRLGLQLPTSGPSKGDIHSLAIGWLSNNDTSTASIKVAARWSHNHGMYLYPGWTTTPSGAGKSYVNFDSTDKTHGTAVVMRKDHSYQSQPTTPVVLTSSAGKFGFVAPWNFTHTDAGINSPNIWGPHAGDIAFSHAGVYFDIYTVYYDVTFRSQIGNVVKKADPVGVVTINPDFDPDAWAANPRPEDFYFLHSTETFQANFENSRPASLGGTRVYITGRGPVDDASGTYTGSANALVENPCDIAGHMIAHYQSSTAFNSRATGSDFGSFATARSVLNARVTGSNWVHTMVVDKKSPFSTVLGSIARQSRCFFQRQVNISGSDLQWRAFVDIADPATDDPGRMFRTTGGLFAWNDITPGSFTAKLTDRNNIANSILLRHGLHKPSGKWAASKYVNPSDSNLDTDASTYVAACSQSNTDYGLYREVVFDAPDVWRPEVAEALCKYYCDIRRERRVIVEFESYMGAIDLQPGHVIKFDDEIGDRIKWPGRTGDGDWSDYQFNVTRVSIISDPGAPLKLHVVAIETISEAA